MKYFAKLLLTLSLLLPTFSFSFAQNNTSITGRITNQYGDPMENVFILVSSSQQSYFSDNSGNFELIVFPNQKIEIIFRHISIDDTTLVVNLKPDEKLVLNIQLHINVYNILSAKHLFFFVITVVRIKL